MKGYNGKLEWILGWKVESSPSPTGTAWWLTTRSLSHDYASLSLSWGKARIAAGRCDVRARGGHSFIFFRRHFSEFSSKSKVCLRMEIHIYSMLSLSSSPQFDFSKVKNQVWRKSIQKQQISSVGAFCDIRIFWHKKLAFVSNVAVGQLPTTVYNYKVHKTDYKCIYILCRQLFIFNTWWPNNKGNHHHRHHHHHHDQVGGYHHHGYHEDWELFRLRWRLCFPCSDWVHFFNANDLMLNTGVKRGPRVFAACIWVQPFDLVS